MKGTLSWILLGLGLALSGCAGEAEPEEVVEQRLAPLPDPDLGLEADVCPDDRHIMWRHHPGPCPAIGSWTGKRLFRAGTTWLANNNHTVSEELGSACVYEMVDPDGDDIEDLYDSPLFESGGPDCEVILPQTVRNDAITDEVDVVAQDLFFEAIGAVDILAVHEGSREYIDVVVVDTEPFARPTNPRSPHGEVLSRMIEAIACPNGTSGCHVRVQRVLGLPRYADGTIDETRGGYFASYKDLAAAIKEATERWVKANAALPLADRSKLIINLSAGWHPYVAFNVGGAGERAVKLAIEDARCHGALFVTSAGNRDSFCAEVPLLPAAWEAESAPNALRCSDVGSWAPPANTALYQPLVHSVGGLDPYGDALENGRVGGRPRLAAAGSHALSGAPSAATKVLTGTSVASAATAGIAALVWSFNGDLGADRIMETIYDGGSALDEPAEADYGLGVAPYDDIVRVHACGALANACDLTGGCPFSGLTCDLTWPAGEDLKSAIDALPVDEEVSPTFSATVASCPAFCGGSINVQTVAGSTPDCGVAETNARDRLLSPQPDTPLCQSCELAAASTPTTRASLNKDYEGRTVQDLSIQVTYKGGAQESFDFDASVALAPEDVTEFDLPEPTLSGEIESATITIELDNGLKQTDPLVLEESPLISPEK